MLVECCSALMLMCASVPTVAVVGPGTDTCMQSRRQHFKLVVVYSVMDSVCREVTSAFLQVKDAIPNRFLGLVKSSVRVKLMAVHLVSKSDLGCRL